MYFFGNRIVKKTQQTKEFTKDVGLLYPPELDSPIFCQTMYGFDIYLVQGHDSIACIMENHQFFFFFFFFGGGGVFSLLFHQRLGKIGCFCSVF